MNRYAHAPVPLENVVSRGENVLWTGAGLFVWNGAMLDAFYSIPDARSVFDMVANVNAREGR